MITRPQIAILDDYQNVALTYGDWSAINKLAEITVFNDHLSSKEEIIQRLKPFQVIAVMRERTPLTREILSQLPSLKLIISTGERNASIDIKAAEEFGIAISPTRYLSNGAPELTWALMLALAKHLIPESSQVRKSGWQTEVGVDLKGKTIGIVGLGRIGSTIAHYAKAFEMEVIAWSQNLTEERAAAQGAKLVSKEELFIKADFVTVHLVLSSRSRGIITEKELNLMKPSAFFINTSRGPLVDEAALISVLTQKKIAAAALDVYEIEPLPLQHPFRTLTNVLATPHIGYVTENTYRIFYEDIQNRIAEWLKE
ncbi:D-2-hydroxyacid dehydrogenase family protein [Pedobacter gandavensis]|uniref:D-2-hydroxyacid dehydrogenase family protein n=1 Tax=Pedobacter gandavensis TaxID=2679963 RepID=UPI002479FFC0|nr:D-2-hydroxyacid dehydrogenase family protein [Pedobacter gandavensis]WGQ10128.1 D-2-hydroxyacid dehydrogenase family protein [Pedobacter gandavensis]